MWTSALVQEYGEASYQNGDGSGEISNYSTFPYSDLTIPQKQPTKGLCKDGGRGVGPSDLMCLRNDPIVLCTLILDARSRLAPRVEDGVETRDGKAGPHINRALLMLPLKH